MERKLGLHAAVKRQRPRAFTAQLERLGAAVERADPEIGHRTAVGDNLKFIWFSGENDKLGEGRNLTGINLEPGNYEIMLIVVDDEGHKSSTTINITIQGKKGDTEEESGKGAVYIGIGIAVVAVVVGIILFFLFLRKRGEAVRAEESKTLGEQKTTPTSQPAQIPPGGRQSQAIATMPPRAFPQPAIRQLEVKPDAVEQRKLLPQFPQPQMQEEQSEDEIKEY